MLSSAPAVAREHAHAAAPEPARTFRNPFRRTAVQRAPAYEAASEEPPTAGAAAAAEAAGVLPDAEPQGTTDGYEAGPAPSRRLTAVASEAPSRGPSLTRAADVGSRVDGVMSPAMEPAVPYRSSATEPATVQGSFASHPALAHLPMPAGLSDVAPPTTAPSEVQRVHSAASHDPAPDGRPARLTVGQARRLGLGTPFSGPHPVPDVTPTVARTTMSAQSPWPTPPAFELPSGGSPGARTTDLRLPRRPDRTPAPGQLPRPAIRRYL